MLIWSEQFETKIELVDLQHQNIFSLLNKLSLLVKQGDLKLETVDSAVKILMHYTKTHLHDEELLMMESRIDPRHLARHRMEHKSFLFDLAKMSDVSTTDENPFEKAEKLVRFIAYWFAFHILGTDFMMAAQMADIKAGLSPQKAFENLRNVKPDSATVKIMLDALVNLWVDARTRNTQLEKKIALLEKELSRLKNTERDDDGLNFQ